MYKISKKLFNDYKATKELFNQTESNHDQSIDNIVNVIRPLIEEHYVKHPCHHNVTSIEFCNDEYMKDKPATYEWVEISEREYNKLYKEENGSYWGNRNYMNDKKDSKLKVDFLEPDFNETFYHFQPVKYEYLRVWVEETWAYGGYDNVIYDFLLTDIMDNVYLRKEKLKSIERIIK